MNDMANLSRSTYFDGLSVIGNIHRDKLYEVSIHADMVKIKATNPPPPPQAFLDAKRNVVSSFSANSRRRMIELLADEIEVPSLFVTLTFDDSYFENWFQFFKKDLESFRRRLERAFPSMRAVWRLELEKRKSGTYKGEYMPHFHLLIWLNEKDKARVMDASLTDDRYHLPSWWHKITGCVSKDHLERYGCHITEVKSRRHAYHYVSKYVSKSSEDNIPVGRRWGRFGSVGQGGRGGVVINRAAYIELKRLITSYQRRTRKIDDDNLSRKTISKRRKFASRIARMNPDFGLTYLGLGVWNSPEFSVEKSTIMKMIRHAEELSEKHEY